MNPIDTSGISPSSRVDTDRKTNGAKAESGGSQGPSSQSATLSDDTVELTDTASRLSQLTDSIQSIEGVDLSKVEAISKSLAEGTYQVDPERIADELIRQEQELV